MKRVSVKFPAAVAAVAAAFLAGAAPASAQVQWIGRGFATVSTGIQAGSQTVTTVGVQEVYDETATFTARQDIESGAFFEISGGYRVWRNLLLGAGYTRFSNSDSAAIDASIPHPLLFDTFRTATATADGLDHTEQAFHITATWMIPLTTKFEVGVFGGPSFYTVKQSYVSSIAFTEVGDPFTAVNLGAPVVDDASESALGYHLGADVTYLVTPRIGVIGSIKFTGASPKFDAIEGADVDAGGAQFGIGLRYRF